MGHPGIEVITSFLAGSGLSAASIAEQREAMAGMAADAPAPPGVVVDTASLGGCAAEWITPEGGGNGGTVLYLHGGGYCIGSLDTHRALGARLARSSGTAVVTLDYRLAPEHPHPAAVDDAVAAYGDLLATGIDPARTAIAGDSAGGGLTVATLLSLRAAGTPLPAAAVCLSPWVDLTQSSDAFDRVGTLDPMVSRAGLDLMAEAYLGGAGARTVLASPLFAEDLAGLPPVMIEVGEVEVLLDDATALADRLRTSGVEVSLTVWPEMIHVFQAFPGELLPEADRSIAAVGEFLSDRIGRPTTGAGPG